VLAFCQPGAQNSPHDDSLFVLTFPADLSTESLALLFVVNPMTRMLFLFFALVPLVSDAARAIAAQPSKVRISYSSRSNSVTPFWVALQKGFFKEEGLDVELIQVNPRLGAIAVLNGDLDFTTTFGTTLRSILQGGFPVKFVFVSVKKSEHSLIVRPEIKDIKGLLSKRFGVATLLGSDQRAGEEMMRAKGFNPSLVKVIQLGDSPVRMQAIRAGIVDVIAIGPPQDLMLKREGYTILAGPQDVEIALPTSGLAATSRMLQENPQLVKRTQRAMLKAHKFVFENKPETVQIMTRGLEQSVEVAERSYELANISLSRDGEITDADWDKLIEKRRTIDEVRDSGLLREAQKELKMR
jgi:NitT/TauT family transport system substrate-binding protein